VTLEVVLQVSQASPSLIAVSDEVAGQYKSRRERERETRKLPCRRLGDEHRLVRCRRVAKLYGWALIEWIDFTGSGGWSLVGAGSPGSEPMCLDELEAALGLLPVPSPSE
jgi:hypothetical protein